MTPKRIREAANALRTEAELIREAHTVGPAHEWDGTEPDAQADSESMLALSRELDALARNAETTSFWVFDPIE